MSLEFKLVQPDKVDEGWEAALPFLLPAFRSGGVDLDYVKQALKDAVYAMLHIVIEGELSGAIILFSGKREGRPVVTVEALGGKFDVMWMNEAHHFIKCFAAALGAKEIEWYTRLPVDAIAARYGFHPVGTLYRKEI